MDHRDHKCLYVSEDRASSRLPLGRGTGRLTKASIAQAFHVIGLYVTDDRFLSSVYQSVRRRKPKLSYRQVPTENGRVRVRQRIRIATRHGYLSSVTWTVLQHQA